MVGVDFNTNKYHAKTVNNLKAEENQDHLRHLQQLLEPYYNARGTSPAKVLTAVNDLPRPPSSYYDIIVSDETLGLLLYGLRDCIRKIDLLTKESTFLYNASSQEVDSIDVSVKRLVEHTNDICAMSFVSYQAMGSLVCKAFCVYCQNIRQLVNYSALSTGEIVKASYKALVTWLRSKKHTPVALSTHGLEDAQSVEEQPIQLTSSVPRFSAALNERIPLSTADRVQGICETVRTLSEANKSHASYLQSLLDNWIAMEQTSGVLSQLREGVISGKVTVPLESVQQSCVVLQKLNTYAKCYQTSDSMAQFVGNLMRIALSTISNVCCNAYVLRGVAVVSTLTAALGLGYLTNTLEPLVTYASVSKDPLVAALDHLCYQFSMFWGHITSQPIAVALSSSGCVISMIIFRGGACLHNAGDAYIKEAPFYLRPVMSCVNSAAASALLAGHLSLLFSLVEGIDISAFTAENVSPDVFTHGGLAGLTAVVGLLLCDVLGGRYKTVGTVTNFLYVAGRVMMALNLYWDTQLPANIGTSGLDLIAYAIYTGGLFVTLFAANITGSLLMSLPAKIIGTVSSHASASDREAVMRLIRLFKAGFAIVGVYTFIHVVMPLYAPQLVVFATYLISVWNTVVDWGWVLVGLPKSIIIKADSLSDAILDHNLKYTPDEFIRASPEAKYPLEIVREIPLRFREFKPALELQWTQFGNMYENGGVAEVSQGLLSNTWGCYMNQYVEPWFKHLISLIK